MDATTTYAQATAGFTAQEIELFQRIDDAEQTAQATRVCAALGATPRDRERNQTRLGRDRAALNALLDGLTPSQGSRYGEFRRTLREWRRTA